MHDLHRVFASQVKLNLSLLEGIKDDVDFCCKLAKEESVIVLPGKHVFLGIVWFVRLAMINQIKRTYSII